jgi:hypothetical protein
MLARVTPEVLERLRMCVEELAERFAHARLVETPP